METVIFILLLGIVFSLGSALTSMTRKDGNARAMANALTLRIVLSLTLVAVLVLGWAFGWIETPN